MNKFWGTEIDCCSRSATSRSTDDRSLAERCLEQLCLVECFTVIRHYVGGCFVGTSVSLMVCRWKRKRRRSRENHALLSEYRFWRKEEIINERSGLIS